MEQALRIFETERLRVRGLTLADLPGSQVVQGNDAVMKYTAGHPQSPKESARDLAEIIARYNVANNETWFWAVTTKNSYSVGTCALFKNELAEREIAYHLDEPYWGLG